MCGNCTFSTLDASTEIPTITNITTDATTTTTSVTTDVIATTATADKDNGAATIEGDITASTDKTTNMIVTDHSKSHLWL